MTGQETVKAPKRWQFFLRLLVSAALLAVLVVRLDLQQLLALAVGIDWVWLIPPFLFFWIGMVLTTYRWQAVLSDFQIREQVGLLFWLTILGFFWNNFLPSTVGGDGYRFLRLRARHPGRDAATFSSVFLDRVYGFLALLVFHFAFLPFYWQTVLRDPWLVWIEAAIILGTLTAAIIWTARRRFDSITVKGEGRLARLLRDTLSKIQKVISLIEQQQPATFWRAGLYSLIFVLLNGLAFWCYFVALGEYPDLSLIVYTSTLAAVVGALPITVNGLGLMEAVYLLLLIPVGLGRESILLAAFLGRGLNLAIAIGSGIGFASEGFFSSLFKRGREKIDRSPKKTDHAE
jgi:uncharacterized protein (TIRG00374 family)